MNTKISSIRPYEKNAKIHPKKQIKQIARSIQEFGFNQPIVVDKDNVIIVGHGRYFAALELGLTEVPVIQLRNLTDEQVKAYRLADNKLNESKWDRGLVVEELRALDLKGFEIEVTGFDRDMLITQSEKDDFVPEVKKAKSKLGDMFQLGDHFLLCGDSTKPEDVDRLMGGVGADMVFTDPPYNVNYQGRGKKTSNTILNDKMAASQFDAFLDGVFQNYRRIMKESGAMYVFHSTTTQAQFEASIVKNGFSVKNQLIWNKPTAAMGWGDYRWKHEPFFYCVAGKKRARFYGDRTNTTIWDFHKNEADLVKWAREMLAAERDGRTTVWTIGRDSVSEYVHPTQKPVELIEHALVNSSKRDDVVCDLFGGSGSTLIACEKTGRVARIMELDPRYVDIIVARWELYTNSKAKKI